jgi:hypothetical protein
MNLILMLYLRICIHSQEAFLKKLVSVFGNKLLKCFYEIPIYDFEKNSYEL